jgi:thiol:disulfide interchange protein
MRHRIGSIPFLTICLTSLMAGSIALAAPPPKAQVSAKLNVSALQPGKTAIVAVIVNVPKGFHAQSATPLDPSYIKFKVDPTADPSLTFLDPIYPAGEIETFAALGRLSVYVDSVTVYLPVRVKADAAVGPLTIAGKVTLQMCDDKACYAPQKPSFSLATEVVAAGATVTPVEPELFKSFDPSVFNPTTAPTTSPATAPAAAAPTSPGSAAGVTPKVFGRDLTSDAYPLAFAAAFLVGIIFNVMPCVLPVVPLKIMGFYEASQHSRRKSITLGAVFSVGVIASFGVLALLIVVLHTIDWGGLFQKPWFTVGIVVVLVAMAFGLFGFFTVNVPTALYSITPRHDNYLGNFLFGVLTAALSTPCTFGMFVGLLAWALKQPVGVGVALIMTVGAGMAFPYFVLSALPEAARRFPRTGPWAEVVKQMMAFLLLATAVYFAQPLLEKAAVSDRVFWWAMFGVIAAGCVFLVVRSVQLSKSFMPRAIACTIALLIFVPSLWAARQLTTRPYQWQPYSDAALASATASGKPVLVDFTATWCGNCHFVEAFVLQNPKIVEAVRDHDIVMLKADVTDDNAPARPLLGKLNPAGAIPLTAVYPPHSTDPRLLDGIYSVDDLLGTIARATAEQTP